MWAWVLLVKPTAMGLSVSRRPGFVSSACFSPPQRQRHGEHQVIVALAGAVAVVPPPTDLRYGLDVRRSWYDSLMFRIGAILLVLVALGGCGTKTVANTLAIERADANGISFSFETNSRSDAFRWQSLAYQGTTHRAATHCSAYGKRASNPQVKGFWYRYSPVAHGTITYHCRSRADF